METAKLDECYEGLIEDIGKPIDCQPLTERGPEFLIARGLPEELVYIWQKHGICGYGQGLWWHTDPSDYDDIVKMWLEGTEYWQPKTNRYHVIGRTAFGDLELWGNVSGNNLKINPLLGMILPSPSKEKKYITTNKIWVAVGGFIGNVRKEDFDTYDVNDQIFFGHALKKLGQLKYNEMYTPIPAPMFSGGLTIDNVQKEEIFTQLTLLREFIDEPQIVLNPMLKYDE